MEKVRVPEGSCGAWRVKHFQVSEMEARLSAMRDGRRYCPAGEYTGLWHGHALVMSDTPAEMRDHYPPVRHATGSVLINGLGLGMVLQAILAKPEVEDVTVVEIAPEVIQLVAPTYADDPRLTVVQADAFTWQPPKGKRYAAVWHDIWTDLTADNAPEMARLHRKYGRRCDWQGSWCHGLLLAERKRDQRERRRRVAFWA